MNIEQIINEFETLGSERTKKRYISQGAIEPIFGMTIKALKPFAKEMMALENFQQLAFDLFDTGNYDLMYLAGMIVDPEKISASKYEDWIRKSYFYMIGDFIVAVCLSETSFAEEIADKWIKSGDDLIMSAGYATYSWMIASKKDESFNKEKLDVLLNYIKTNISSAPNQTKYAMYYLLYNIGVSYLPLHEEALKVAEDIGKIKFTDPKGKEQIYNAKEAIDKEIKKGNIGFKRRNVRC